MLRRLFRLGRPATAADAWDNLIVAGRWVFGLLVLTVAVGVGARTAFPGDVPPIVGAVIALMFLPPLVALLAVFAELGAVLRSRAIEKATRGPTGNPLIDHDALVGVIVVVVLLVGSTLWVLLRQPK
jgi:phosphate/sulfate permease